MDSRNQESIPIHECRCDERLKPKGEETTSLEYTGFLGELEHPKIKTRLVDEMFASVMGEYVFSIEGGSHVTLTGEWKDRNGISKLVSDCE